MSADVNVNVRASVEHGAHVRRVEAPPATTTNLTTR
jgi:hypothetical protein